LICVLLLVLFLSFNTVFYVKKTSLTKGKFLGKNIQENISNRHSCLWQFVRLGSWEQPPDEPVGFPSAVLCSHVRSWAAGKWFQKGWHRFA